MAIESPVLFRKFLFLFLSNNILCAPMRPNYSFMLHYFVWIFEKSDKLNQMKRLIDEIHGPMAQCPFHFALSNIQSIVQRILQVLYAPAPQFDDPPESCLSSFREHCDLRTSMTAFCLNVFALCVTYDDWR